MVKPIEVMEEPPLRQSQTKAMTKLQVGNALLAVNAGLMTSDRTKLAGSEKLGGTERRQWQLDNTSAVTPRPSAEDMMLKERAMSYENKLVASQTEKPIEDDSQAGRDSPRLLG